MKSGAVKSAAMKSSAKKSGGVGTNEIPDETPDAGSENSDENLLDEITKSGSKVEFTVDYDNGPGSSFNSHRFHATMIKPVVGRKAGECLGKRYRGYVRRFVEKWGFVNCAAFDGDLFLHLDNVFLISFG